MPEEGINPVELPPEMTVVWDWFLVLHSKRQPSIAGPSPILESEIGWFFHNRQIIPDGWELGVLTRLDDLAREH